MVAFIIGECLSSVIAWKVLMQAPPPSMRSIGAAERALDLMVARVSDPERKTFGRLLREHGTIIQDIAKSRCDIDQARLLVYAAAHQMDTGSVRQAIVSVAEAKAVIPKMVGEVIDRAMQAFGAEGISRACCPLLDADSPSLTCAWLLQRTRRWPQCLRACARCDTPM